MCYCKLPKTTFPAFILSLLGMLALWGGSRAFADQGHPIAIRSWPDRMLSIETHWNLQVVVRPNELGMQQLHRRVDFAVFSGTKTNKVRSWAKLNSNVQRGEPSLLFRTPNSLDARVLPISKVQGDPHPSAVQLRGLSSPDSSDMAIQIQVDGVRIWIIENPNAVADWRNDVDPDADGRTLDVLVIPAANSGSENLAVLVEQIQPHTVLLTEYTEKHRDVALRAQQAIASNSEPFHVGHNTFAVSSGMSREDSPVVVTLSPKPWPMPAEISQLFSRMETSCRDSQKVFEKLSVDQMNFKPANGTHTPRWNTEHMMGRQLLFFSQIFHAQRPTIPVMNLNPKQMPPDYRAAHPDWDGAEESRQMERVSAFTRRYAYLLEGIPLDEKAPGSQWTLRRLLLQMERHYSEHTANTIKKFELPGWPKSDSASN